MVEPVGRPTAACQRFTSVAEGDPGLFGSLELNHLLGCSDGGSDLGIAQRPQHPRLNEPGPIRWLLCAWPLDLVEIPQSDPLLQLWVVLIDNRI